MTGVSQYWFSEHFRQVFSTLMHYPALTLGLPINFGCGSRVCQPVYPSEYLLARLRKKPSQSIMAVEAEYVKQCI